uniref:Uncharacterized protein n=1 Tax=Fusarium oxysporum (strain Fo5176) TaxID=660025 RepID=A0A0C4BKU9_FUSOF
MNWEIGIAENPIVPLSGVRTHAMAFVNLFRNLGVAWFKLQCSLTHLSQTSKVHVRMSVVNAWHDELLPEVKPNKLAFVSNGKYVLAGANGFEDPGLVDNEAFCPFLHFINGVNTTVVVGY